MSHEEIMNDLQYPTQNVRLDLVSVVRCKDCRRAEVYNLRDTHWYLCNWWECEVNAYDYCSRGKRRDEAR